MADLGLRRPRRIGRSRCLGPHRRPAQTSRGVPPTSRLRPASIVNCDRCSRGSAAGDRPSPKSAACPSPSLPFRESGRGQGRRSRGRRPFSLDAGPTRSPTLEEAPDEAAASSAPRCRISPSFLPSFLATPKPAPPAAARRGRPDATRHNACAPPRSNGPAPPAGRLPSLAPVPAIALEFRRCSINWWDSKQLRNDRCPPRSSSSTGPRPTARRSPSRSTRWGCPTTSTS